MKVTRKAYKRIKWLVLVVAIALVSTAVPLGVFLSAPTVEAVDVTTWDQMRSAIQGTGSGSSLTVNIATGTTMSPGYEDSDYEHASNPEALMAQYPAQAARIRLLTGEVRYR